MKDALEAILDRLGPAAGVDHSVARLIQSQLEDLGELAQLAAGEPCPLGELLVDSGALDASRLHMVLEEQVVTKELFGEVLVRQGSLSAAQRDIALEFQRHQREMAAEGRGLRLGRILLARGDVTTEQLGAALIRQRGSGRKLGEELIAAGHLDERRVIAALVLQKKLVTAALAVALALAPAAADAMSRDGVNSASVQTDFVVKIPVTVALRSLYQLGQITIEQRDIDRGYVEVPSASLIELVANMPYGVHFGTHATWFKSVKVSGFPDELQFGNEGGRYFEHSKKPERGQRNLSYRFELEPRVAAGTYEWPLSLTVSLL